MRIEEISCENGDTDELLAKLRGKVFHLTTKLALNSIQESGAIENNQLGQFNLNTSSENSFGRLMGWICFFDLRNAAPSIIQETLDSYYFLSPPWFSRKNTQENLREWDLAYLILDHIYHDHLIPFEKLHEHFKKTGEWLQGIPKVETWIADRVPITWIEKVILANVRE